MDSFKHQPATPLPWKRVDWLNGAVTGEGFTPIFSGSTDHGELVIEGRPRDFAYIAHAANAYPKLVEALREMRLIAEAQDRAGDEAVPAAYRTKTLHDAVELGNALLRELGEE